MALAALREEMKNEIVPYQTSLDAKHEKIRELEGKVLLGQVKLKEYMELYNAVQNQLASKEDQLISMKYVLPSTSFIAIVYTYDNLYFI